jgi:signal peptidase I
VIVFHAPANPNDLIVKRIVALPGDVIDSRAGSVRVGGHTLAEPYLARPASSGAIDAQIVPADCFFVMGDNRDRSYDSRHWGALPRDLVIGRARMILWSSPPTIYDAPVHASTLRDVSRPTERLRVSRIFKWVE